MTRCPAIYAVSNGPHSASSAQSADASAFHAFHAALTLRPARRSWHSRRVDVRPNGATVNSQGRQPLDRGPPTPPAPEGGERTCHFAPAAQILTLWMAAHTPDVVLGCLAALLPWCLWLRPKAALPHLPNLRMSSLLPALTPARSRRPLFWLKADR